MYKAEPRSEKRALQQAIAAYADRFEGVISLAAKDLKTGANVLFHADRKCPTASVIKLPILVHVLLLAHEGLLSLDEIVLLKETDKTPGSGILTHLGAGLQLTMRDACVLMIALSDNTATNMVIDRVGIEPINARMRTLGLMDTRLFRKVFSTGPAVSTANRRYGLGVTTPRDILRLLSAIHAGTVGDAETCVQIRSILGKQQYRDAIPRLLPAGSVFQGKSGAVDAVRNDVGFITLGEGDKKQDIALAVFCQKIPRVLWTADNPGHLAIAHLSRMIVDYFGIGG